MPKETQAAVSAALSQTYIDSWGSLCPISANTPQQLVDAVRSYFNANGVTYATFDFDSLKPFLG